MNYLPYLGILVAAALEGEVVYSGAAVMVHLGKLNGIGVLISGSVGGWAGDQFYFYLARGRARSWLDRLTTIARRRRAVEARMQRHGTKLMLAVRFLPGLRIAIPLACAYAGVSPFKFSGLTYISAIGWAAAVLFLITSLGPTSMSALGLKAWWAPVIPAILVVAFFRWLSRSTPEDLPREL